MSARITEAMVEAYKHAFGDYLNKVTSGLVLPPTPDVSWHATKYALEAAAALSTEPGEAEGMVLVPRNRLEAWRSYLIGFGIDVSDLDAMLAAAPDAAGRSILEHGHE